MTTTRPQNVNTMEHNWRKMKKEREHKMMMLIHISISVNFMLESFLMLC